MRKKTKTPPSGAYLGKIVRFNSVKYSGKQQNNFRTDLRQKRVAKRVKKTLFKNENRFESKKDKSVLYLYAATVFNGVSKKVYKTC